MSDDRFASAPTLDPSGDRGDGAPVLRLELVGAWQARGVCDAAKKETGFLLPLAGRPKLFQVVEVPATCGDAFELDFDARVIQAFERPGADGTRYQVAFQIEGWNPGRDAELRRKMGASGREIAESEFSEARVVRETLNLYRTMTAQD